MNIINSENIRVIKGGKIKVDGYKWIIDYPIIYVDVEDEIRGKTRMIEIGEVGEIYGIGDDTLMDEIIKRNEEYKEGIPKEIYNIIISTKVSKRGYKLEREEIKWIKENIGEIDRETYYKILITCKIMGYTYEEVRDIIRNEDEKIDKMDKGEYRGDRQGDIL